MWLLHISSSSSLCLCLRVWRFATGEKRRESDGIGGSSFRARRGSRRRKGEKRSLFTFFLFLGACIFPHLIWGGGSTSLLLPERCPERCNLRHRGWCSRYQIFFFLPFFGPCQLHLFSTVYGVLPIIKHPGISHQILSWPVVFCRLFSWKQGCT